MMIYQITTADAVSDSDFYPFHPEAKVMNNIYHPQPCPSVQPCNVAVSYRTKNALRHSIFSETGFRRYYLYCYGVKYPQKCG